MIKKFSQNFLIRIIFILLSASLLYFVLKLKLLFIISIIGLLLNLLCLAIIQKLDGKSIKLLVKLYLTIIILYLFSHTIILMYNDVSDIFLWYLTPPLALYVVFSYKRAAVLSIIVLISTFISAILFKYFNLFNDYLPKFDENQRGLIKIFTLLGAFYLILFCLYFIRVKQQILSSLNIEKKRIPEPAKNESLNENQKYKFIFESIVSYLEEYQPWKNPDFNISELATLLNTNPSYISRAINQESEYNFNTLINFYRINYVKNELKNNLNGKYTLMFIYNSAGFNHQSTFNKAFKQVEGITPTQYIHQIQKNKNSE